MQVIIGPEIKLVDQFKHFAKRISAAKFIDDFRKDLPDFILDACRACCALTKLRKIGEQFGVHEPDQIVTRSCLVAVEAAVSFLRCSPCRPAMRVVKNGRVRFASQPSIGFRVQLPDRRDI